MDTSSHRIKPKCEGFAVASSESKKLLDLLGTQRDRTRLRCLMEQEQFKIRNKEGKQVDSTLVGEAAVTLREQLFSKQVGLYIVGLLHKTLDEVILFCAKQQIALRGHHEGVGKQR